MEKPQVTVVDARMGRGKSSAAIRYMQDHPGEPFLYITPYLSEVDRVCRECAFSQPTAGEESSKSFDLRMMLLKRRNIAASHALFYLLDDSSLELVRSRGYTLIIDESVSVIEKVNVTSGDFKIITEVMTEEDGDGFLRWKDRSYSGSFSGYKELADARTLIRFKQGLLSVLRPELFTSFRHVFMLTYMFKGQYQRAYLDYYRISYEIVGVCRDQTGFFFSNEPDDPPPADYQKLISIEYRVKLNAPGNSRTALSKCWFSREADNSQNIRTLKNGMRTFFKDVPSKERLWTTFKDSKRKLIDSGGHFRNDFLQVSARATNDYRQVTHMAYMANRFAEPSFVQFFYERGVTLDHRAFALSEMLQWIWRGAIRDGKPVRLYIPSKRMRDLLTDWISRNSTEGGDADE